MGQSSTMAYVGFGLGYVLSGGNPAGGVAGAALLGGGNVAKKKAEKEARRAEDEARIALMGREKASRDFRTGLMSAQEKAAAAARAGGKARATTMSAGSRRRNTVPGQRGTILTSPQGVLDDADSGLGGIRGRRRKTLLGS